MNRLFFFWSSNSNITVKLWIILKKCNLGMAERITKKYFLEVNMRTAVNQTNNKTPFPNEFSKTVKEKNIRNAK